MSSSLSTPLKSQYKYPVLDLLILKPLPSKVARHSCNLAFRLCLLSTTNTISSAKIRHHGRAS
ncbi:hypothetical protein Hanom_Chr00s002805g01704921 [Helianthus anomalus]